MTSRMSERPRYQPRAQRFSLQIPILYRRQGDDTWLTGESLNISRSGVLFSAAIPLEPALPVELLLLMGEPPREKPVANIHCRARIARAAGLKGDARPSLAARFSDYQFVPADAGN
jgi:hypothetical protein